MNKEFLEIFDGFKSAFALLKKQEKRLLFIASFLMLITGTLTNLPAIFLGKLVDQIIATKNFQFAIAIPFILLIVVIIILRELITVLRKYLVENTVTQTEKEQTVAVVNHLLKTDITSLNEQQIGSLYGKTFRSIQGLVRLLKLSFLDFLPVIFSAAAAIVLAFLQKPFLASFMILVIPTGLFIIVRQISSQKGIRVELLRGKERIDGAVVEMLGGIETIRVLNTSDQEVNKVENIAEELRKKEIRHHISMALFDSGKYLNETFFIL